MSDLSPLICETLSGNMLANGDIIEIAKDVASELWYELVEQENKANKDEVDGLKAQLAHYEVVLEIKSLLITSPEFQLEQANSLHIPNNTTHLSRHTIFNISLSDTKFTSFTSLNASNSDYISACTSLEHTTSSTHRSRYLLAGPAIPFRHHFKPNYSAIKYSYHHTTSLFHFTSKFNKFSFFQRLKTFISSQTKLVTMNSFKIPKMKPVSITATDLRNRLTVKDLPTNNDMGVIVNRETASSSNEENSSAHFSRENEVFALELRLANTPDISSTSSENSDSAFNRNATRKSPFNRSVPSVVTRPDSRFDRNQMERDNNNSASTRDNNNGASTRVITGSYMQNAARLIEIRVSGIPKSMSTDHILRALKFDKRNEICSSITYLSDYTSIYQFASTKTVILKMRFDSAKTLIERGTALIDRIQYRCTRITRLTQCTLCLRYSHTKKNCTYSTRCGHCAGAHNKHDCDKLNSPQVCVNCVDDGLKPDVAAHTPFFFGCPVRRMMIKKAERGSSN